VALLSLPSHPFFPTGDGIAYESQISRLIKDLRELVIVAMATALLTGVTTRNYLGREYAHYSEDTIAVLQPGRH
jgi:hypothetical protein